MGVLGPRGTHSEAAGFYLSEQMQDVELVMEPDIFDCLQAVEDGEVDMALVPVENSLEGVISITLDTLAGSSSLTVTRELIWPVHNQLMAKCKPEEVSRIYSHPQPISQCRNFLRQHYPQAEIIKTTSTARAAELVGEEPAFLGWAAICPARAGQLYGLTPLAREIQDNMANCTRFFLVEKQGEASEKMTVPEDVEQKMLVICQIDGSKSGALYEVLGEFARRGVNMTRIESRPARTVLGAYIFFFDLEVDTCSPAALLESLYEVEKKSIWLKKLGPFPVFSAANK
ncbi:prephenate dehydratase [Selenomonas sp. AB3002]|uniref:prephenate dehydratase n=1 Tax=Selenomonas sp. AB3002 TaxID=1392502 RepID=UPI00049794ED